MVSDGAFIFHIYVPWGKTLTKVQVICQGQGQISSSLFSRKGLLRGAFVFHKHILYFGKIRMKCNATFSLSQDN